MRCQPPVISRLPVFDAGAEGFPARTCRVRLDQAQIVHDVRIWQRSGDETARERVIATVLSIVTRYARQLCPPGADPADLRQELLAFALDEAMRSYREESGLRFAAFLMKCVARYARRWRDRERPIHALPLIADYTRRPEGTVNRERFAVDFTDGLIERMTMNEAMLRMPRNAREARFLQFLLDGCTITECALRLQISRQRADQLLHRMRLRLRSALEVEGGESGVGIARSGKRRRGGRAVERTTRRNQSL